MAEQSSICSAPGCWAPHEPPDESCTNFAPEPK
jgi:hypothetical protein